MKLFLFLICLFCTVLPAAAYACSLAPSHISLKTFARQADVIFKGRPIKIGKRYPKLIASKNTKEINDVFFNAPYEVTFDVDQHWKGVKGKHIYILDDGTTCGHNLRDRVEESMLVFGRFDNQGLRIMHISSPAIIALSESEKIDALNQIFKEKR